MRRYLKSEPKYDLISFFILRDPWDSQHVNERELSLIPFPVERLFNQELPNFRVVVVQNFALFQFLQQPQYQHNLVKFVKQGGGLFFIGGPRALQTGDLASSALAEILPFEKPEDLVYQPTGLPFGLGQRIDGNDGKGPYYDKDEKFQITPANPTQEQKALANIYDEWATLSEELVKLKGLEGLHRTDNVKFKKSRYTPLLNATTKAGKKLPLAVASYPGKGRAMWVFTDALWQMAMAPPATIARQTYHQFMHSAITWLMREEVNQPLIAKNLVLRLDEAHALRWYVDLQGPASKFFEKSKSWQVSVCSQEINPNQFTIDRIGEQEVRLIGRIDTSLRGGERCRFKISGNHPAFGSVKAHITEIFPRIFKDDEVGQAPHKLDELARLTGAKLAVIGKDNAEEALASWLDTVSGREGVALPNRYKSMRNFYWVLQRWWVWALLALLPLEILIRRWHLLTGSSRRGIKNRLFVWRGLGNPRKSG